MDFSQLNKQRAHSFDKQRTILKKLGKGKTILCETCQQPLTLDLATSNTQQGIICCAQGCTHIELELG
ncbi:hypothetical protein J8L98_10105 [Pseudoalteromonas sp. MMG013]|uniref:Uncharacterized protein n=1 Tax=Pseudoalteromonas aurantia 208 TaxID=1314867 RepID=A0ABR9EFL8_9GAMM|nr:MULTISPECIES: hypothetical protein [Pseudoalteromonas]MBE0369786.1 hypothetical protein [Pseudoalteromonas aurantia 208]MBQ4844751.1 hypothetical protein [Pseudoalteromonas sp. MMG005]MBQ4862042.1 hypothetical protein [Pseudoalteromonas sp. MMG013]